MNKTTTFFLVVILIVVILLLLNSNKTALRRLELKINNLYNERDSSTIFLVAQSVEMCMNIDSINGNGNAIGNNNVIKNNDYVRF